MRSVQQQSSIERDPVVYRASSHFVPFLGPLVLALFGLAIFIIDTSGGSSALAGVVALVIIGVAFELAVVLLLRRVTTECAVTTRRLNIRRGVLHPRDVSWPLEALRSIEVEQNGFGRMLHFGTLVVTPAEGACERIALCCGPRRSLPACREAEPSPRLRRRARGVRRRCVDAPMLPRRP